MTTFDLAAIARSYPCPYCTAGVGEPCRTKTGRPTHAHAARSQPLWRVWNAGYSDALRDVANNPGWWGRARHRYLIKETP